MKQSNRRHVQKALAYITHSDHLLVFIQIGRPDAGIQVPGGTIEPGESRGVVGYIPPWLSFCPNHQ